MSKSDVLKGDAVQLTMIEPFSSRRHDAPTLQNLCRVIIATTSHVFLFAPRIKSFKVGDALLYNVREQRPVFLLTIKSDQ